MVLIQTDLADKERSQELDIGLFGTNGGGLLLHGVVPSLEEMTRNYKLVDGRFLSDDLKEREIVLVETYAKDEEIVVGDLIKIITPNGDKELKVVGLIAREGPGQTNNGSFGVIPIKAAQEMFNRSDNLDQIDIVPENSNPSTAELSALRVELQERIGKDYSVTYPSGQGERMTQMLQNYQIGLNFMSGIALFVGAFLIYNAFAMTVIERTREFGVLRTIGMSRSQVMGQVFIEAAMLGVIGAGLGVVLGIFLARGLTSLMEVILNQKIDNVQVSSPDIIFSFLLGIGITFSGCRLASHSGRTHFTHRSIAGTRQIKRRVDHSIWLDHWHTAAGWFSFFIGTQSISV